MKPIIANFLRGFKETVLGKLFGGAFGFLVGGPLGALFGAAVGHNYDQRLWTLGSKSAGGDQDRVPAQFIRIAFELMGYIAKTDGRVSEAEISATRTVMQHLGLNDRQQRTAIDCFTAGKQPDYSVDAALETLRKTCANRFGLLHQLLEMQLNVAYADGALHPRTHDRLRSIAGRLGMPHLQFDALHGLFRARHHQSRGQRQQNDARADNGHAHDYRTHSSRPTTGVNSLGQAYAILGLKPEAGTDDIKLAYRRLLKRHHPDKLAAGNASAAEIKKATEKTREITAAYERIREARGF